jgi:hypothetical protein
MKAIPAGLGLAALLCVLIVTGGCIMEEKVVELVFTGETCVDFEEDHATGEFSSQSVIEFGQDLVDILNENDLDRSDIAQAMVMGGSYEVTDFTHGHDWTVSGSILVERLDLSGEPQTLLAYTSQSLSEALDNQIWVELETAGVSVLNGALQDFLNGGYPQLRFTVENGTTSPAPGASDHIVFDWQTCIKMHFIYTEEFDFPDP